MEHKLKKVVALEAIDLVQTVIRWNIMRMIQGSTFFWKEEEKITQYSEKVEYSDQILVKIEDV